jgi:hypothetical protein
MGGRKGQVTSSGKKIIPSELGVIVHACNHSSPEAKAGEWRLLGQTALYSKVPSQKQNKTKKNQTNKERKHRDASRDISTLFSFLSIHV